MRTLSTSLCFAPQRNSLLSHWRNLLQFSNLSSSAKSSTWEPLGKRPLLGEAAFSSSSTSLRVVSPPPVWLDDEQLGHFSFPRGSAPSCFFRGSFERLPRSQLDEGGWLGRLLPRAGGREEAGDGYVHNALAQLRIELPATGSKSCY